MFAWAARNGVRGLLLALALVSFPSVAARFTISSDPEYLLDRWETSDGLPENSATSIVQTQDGYLWFGTFNGLVRFDGVRFKTFDVSNTPELPNGEIVNVFATANGDLWVSTTAGLARRSGSNWMRFGGPEGWAGNYVRSFAQNANGQVLVSTFDGHLLEFVKGRFHELPAPPGIPQTGYIAVGDEDQKWWAIQNGFIGSWTGREWESRLAATNFKSDEVGAGTARKAGLWLVTGRELRLIKSGAVVSSKTLPESPGGFWHLFEDSVGNVWISTRDRGVLQIRPDGGVKRWDAGSGLGQNGRCVFEDGEGNIWIGTSGSGLVRLKRKRVLSLAADVGLPEVGIRSVVRGAQGELWTATYGKGLYRRNGSAFGFTKSGLEGDNHDGNDLHLQTELYDSSGRLWVGSWNRGYAVIENGSPKVGDAQPVGSNVWTFFEDQQKRIWMGGDEQVASWTNGRLTVFGNGDGLRGREFRSFAQDLDGTIWTANSESVFRLNGAKFEEVRAEAAGPIRSVLCMLGDSKGGMWLGTANGLLYWKNGRAFRFGWKQGLRVSTIRSIAPDENGVFWLGSNQGILRVVRADLEAVIEGKSKTANFILVGQSDGMASGECASGQTSWTRDTDGKLWFATLRGMAVIDPAHFMIRTNPPILHIDEASYTDTRGKRKVFRPDQSTVVLVPPGSTRFEAVMTGLSYSDPEAITYSYTMSLDDEEIASDQQAANLLSSERLAPGAYRLSIKASNGDGATTAQPIFYRFNVQAFYWEKPLFQVSAILAAIATIIGITYGWIRFRLRNQIQEISHQKAVQTLERRLAAVLQSTTDLVAFASREGKILYLNEAGKNILGVPVAEDVVGMPISNFHTVDSFRSDTVKALNVAREKGTWAGESRLLRKDGQEIVVSQVMMAHRGTDGRVEFFSTIARDISERLRSEEALRESEERYRAVVEFSPIGVVVSVDDIVVFVNAAATAMTGVRDSSEIIGRSVYGFMHPDVREKARVRRRRALEHGEAAPALESGVLQADGSVRFVEGYAVPLTYGGKPAILNFMVDITERKQAETQRAKIEAAIREAEELYRSVVEALPVAIVVAIDERIVFANSTMLKARNKTLNDVVGQSVLDLIPAEYHEVSRTGMANVISTGIPVPPIELAIPMENGSVRVIESQGIRIVYEGQPAIMIFSQDLTSRRLAELEREKIARELQQLTARLLRVQDEERRRIGRELHDSTGQTLAALEINLGMLLRRLSAAGGREAELIDESSKLASQCSEEIRTTSYLLHPPLLDEVGLNSALRWYADGFSKRSHIQVTLEIPETSQRFAEEIELSLFRVVQEALTNVHRHSASETATIRFRVDGDDTCLEVCDSGKGIDAEKLRLFREGHSNLGVGISGMRERIRQLGGELVIESSARGTSVRVRVPGNRANK